MVPKIQFFANNFFDFYSKQNRKENVSGEFQELFKSGLRIVFREKPTPGKSEQIFQVICI